MEIKAPGLKRVDRAGKTAYYWACSEAARKAGYPVRTVPLRAYGDDPAEILAACRRLQGDMLTWMAGETEPRDPYDGTFAGLIRLYTTHGDSRFQTLKPSSRRPYIHYAKVIERTVGARLVRAVKGLEVKQWVDNWSSGGEAPAAGHFALSVLKAALAFGQLCGKPECKALREDIKLLALAGLLPREGVFTRAQVEGFIKAAHDADRPSLALATAIQFETGLRQWDVIGQWLPLSTPGLSAITKGDRKWIGLAWSDIDADLVLTFTPGKTAEKSQARIAVDLTLCPLVMAELARIPAERRGGPVIVSEAAGLPYEAGTFRVAWRRVADKAGIPKALWSRDLRASAVTEARQHGASTDDAAKVAGHTKPKMTARVYDRDRLEAARRFSRARQNGPKT